MNTTSLEFYMMLYLAGFASAAILIFALMAGQHASPQPQSFERRRGYRRYEYEPHEESGPGCSSVVVIAVFITLLICVIASFG